MLLTDIIKKLDRETAINIILAIVNEYPHIKEQLKEMFNEWEKDNA